MVTSHFLLIAATGLLAAACVQAASAPGASAPVGPIRLENDRIALTFDGGTGAWTGLVDKSTGEDLVAAPGPSAPLAAAATADAASRAATARRAEPAGSCALTAHGPAADGLAMEMTVRCGPWQALVEYRLAAGSPLGWRQFAIVNASDRPQVVRSAPHDLPHLRPGDEPAAIFPGTLPVGDLRIAGMNRARPPRPRSQDPLAYLWSAKARRGVGAWFYSEDEYSPVSVLPDKGGSAAAIRHSLGVLAPLKPGEKAVLGRQFFWLVHGTRDDLLRSVRRVYDLVGLRPPSGGLDRLAERVIYNAHPGGMPEQGFRGYGGFRALEAYLPTVKKMGADLLWLLPIFEHGDGRKWNLYSPFDHFQISPLYGTPEELKSLSAAARGMGIDLMFDLVPHGPPDHTPLAKAHPEWVCLKEDGKPTYVWGQLAFDNAHPGWQEYMRRAAEHNAREYGVVGARVDVAAGSPPNWDARVGYRPSHSTLGGGLGMDRAIRGGFAAVHKGVVLLPEEYTGANVFCRDADLTYDAQLFFLMVDLQAADAPPARWAADLARLLHDQSLTVPPGSIKMRWTANHDTVSWTFQKKRTRAAYGPDRARALLALCCLIDGVPMIYQGEEDPSLYGGKGESIVEYIAGVTACRRRLPALARGSADYQSVTASGGVFACLRRHGTDCAIVLVSFSPHAVASTLSLPPDLAGIRRWKDELSGEELPAPDIPMANHQVRVLTPLDRPAS